MGLQARLMPELGLYKPFWRGLKLLLFLGGVSILWRLESKPPGVLLDDGVCAREQTKGTSMLSLAEDG